MKQQSTAIILSLMLILITASLTSAQSINQDGITITSDKEHYFCEPIFSNKGCLIKATITTKYDSPEDANLVLITTYATQKTITPSKIEITSEKNNGQQETKPNQKKEEKKDTITAPYKQGDQKTQILEFWAASSGEFNITIEARDPNNNKIIHQAKLDPFFNNTINTTIPTLWLVNGTNKNSSNNQYQNTTDITASLNDNDDSTSYTTLPNQPYAQALPIVDRWNFNDHTAPIKIKSFLGTHNADIISGQLIQKPITGSYYASYFNGTTIANINNATNADLNFAATDEFTACIVVNTTYDSPSEKGIFARRIGTSGVGIEFTMPATDQVQANIEGASNSQTLTTTLDINDGIPHMICVVKTQNILQTVTNLYMDGVLQDTASTLLGIGAINITRDVYFGSRDGGSVSTAWTGAIDQVSISRIALNATFLNFTNNDKQLNNVSKGISISAYFNHTMDTATKNYSIYIRANSTISTTSVRIRTYTDSTNVNLTNYLDATIGNGDNFIPINNLVPNGYNQPLRIEDIVGGVAKISEVRLFETINDTKAPSITNCTANTNALTCDQNWTLRCNITDDQAIATVFFGMTHSDQTTHIHIPNMINGLYEVNHLVTGTYNQTVNVTFFYANATDTAGNKNTTNPALQATYTCLNTPPTINFFTTNASTINNGSSANLTWDTLDATSVNINQGIGSVPTTGSLMISPTINTTYNLTATNGAGTTSALQTIIVEYACNENWQPNYGTCQTNDTQFKTYNDLNTCGTNNTLPIDNGSNSVCNYCTEDIQQNIGTCEFTNTENITYTDNNYASCCAITSLSSDCGILTSPYNETTNQSCFFLTQNFNCTLDTTPVLNDKINIACDMPDNDEYSCVVNTYQTQGNTRTLLATAPEYKKTSDNFIFLPQQNEERTSFTPTNRLLNAYYTEKELRPSVDYLIEVKCNSNSTTYLYQEAVTPTQHTFDFANNWVIYIGQHPILTIMSLLAIILVVIIATFIIKKFY